MKIKNVILSIILGVIAGPLQMGSVYLLIGKNESNNLFIFLGLLLGFMLIYRIFLSLLYRIAFRKYSFDERDEYKSKTVLISKVSYVATYFIVLYFIAKEGLVTSIILTILLAYLPTLAIGVLIAPFSNLFESNEKTPTNNFKYKRSYLKDKYGNIVGTADKISYDGKYGGWERTEYKDNNGKVIVKEDTNKF